MTRWLVTGSAGMLGQDLTAVLVAAGHQVTRAPRAALDVTDLTACRVAVRGHDVVVNAAAWTAVDDVVPAHRDPAGRQVGDVQRGPGGPGHLVPRGHEDGGEVLAQHPG